jgi:tRNA nucleotidyltransferase/poly(A) polymerase
MNWYTYAQTERGTTFKGTNINLTPKEEQIFDFLRGINDKYNLGLTFRVAGGWVRDKMLGKESDDIDIAIDKMTGGQLAQYLERELGGITGNLIEARPDQSKHLETLTIKLFGQEVDFVNLRSESYGDTRIPEMQFGNAEQDAFRRDLTINSLFYNINNGEVEDFTGKGVEDLKTMTLRTPMDPLKTFKDDPLRVLRALRFYSRYSGSQLAPDMVEAMRHPEVLDALDPKNLSEQGNRKISEERILKEWQKLFRGSQAGEALRVLHDTGIWDRVFVSGAVGDKGEDSKNLGDFNPFTMDQNNAWHVDNVLEHTLKVVNLYDEILRADGADDDDRARSLAAAFLHDFGKLDPDVIGQKEVEGVMRNTYHGHEDVSALAAEAILRGIKSSNEEIEYISKIVKEHMKPHSLIDGGSAKAIRKFVRKLGKHLARRIVQHAKADSLSKPGGDGAAYDKLMNQIDETDFIDKPNAVKPVVDGRTIMQMFPEIPPKTGFIRDVNERLLDLQDENPALTFEEAVAFINSIAGDIRSRYASEIGTLQPVQPAPANVPQQQNQNVNL